LQRSIEYFQQSLAKDPKYAPAWAGIADSYGLLALSDAPPLEKFTKAKEAAQKALSLDDSLAEAHTSLAMVKVLYDWDWPGAETEFRRAIALNSGYATAHHWYGVNLAAFGRLGEAKLELARALDLDPLSPIINVNSGYPFYFERNYQEALTRYAKALELKPDFVVGHEDRLLLMEQMGNPAEAAREAVYCANAYGTPDLARLLRTEYDLAGYPALLRRWLTEGEKMAATTYVSPMLLASLSVRIGDKVRALGWLERAYEQRSPPLIYIGADPQYDPLRGDPRFRSLLQRAGLLVVNKLHN
jgi:tetratricopeptide (TPR) repeat protein